MCLCSLNDWIIAKAPTGRANTTEIIRHFEVSAVRKKIIIHRKVSWYVVNEDKESNYRILSIGVPVACCGPWLADGSFPAGSLGPLVAFLFIVSTDVDRRLDNGRRDDRNDILVCKRMKS